MAGFDIGRFLETGGKYAYEILSEEKKHKEALEELDAKIRADDKKQKELIQAGVNEGRVKGLYDFMKSDASGESKVKMWEMHSSEGLVPSMYQIQNIAATQAGQTMPGGTAGATTPGGVAGVGGLYDGTQYTPPETGGIPKMFEPQPEEPKKYPQTRGEVREHEEFKAGLKPEPEPQLGKTPEERQLDRDLDIVGKYAPYEDDEKQLRKMGVLEMVRSARNRLQKKAAYQRYANDADNYFDRMLNLYKGNKQKAKEETIKFIRLMGIEPSILQPYLKER